MTIKTFGYVESYDNLKKLSPGAFDIVQVDKQKELPDINVLDLRILDKKETSVPLLHPNGGLFIWDKNADDSEDGHDTISPNSTPSKGRWKRLVENLSVKWFGAKGDMNQHYIGADGIISRYRGKITSRSYEFQLTSTSNIDSKDEGKTIVIWKPGLKNGYLVSKIKKVKVDGLTLVELEHSASATISDAYVAWGTDDTDAIQNAIDITERTGLAVYLPPGHYIVTKTLIYSTIDPDRDPKDAGRYWPNYPFRLMKPGLRMFGAGSQVSFIHSLIEKNKDNATIKLDGTGDIKGRINFQQTGHLKDLSICSIGYFEGSPLSKGIETKGIDLMATWAYTIENVAIMDMGSDGINIRNLFVEGGSSDWDQTDKLRLDNLLVFANHGWGIKVDAAERAASTSKIHIDRCKIEENKSGGIQWTGQGGTIERCGLYGNGNKDSLEDTYGILVKNMKVTSNGLLITGCEIQDNGSVQVMIAVGANIRIVQNDFKIDKTNRWPFPKVDVQVGDGNMESPGGARTVNGCVIEDNRIRGSYGGEDWDKAPEHTVVKVNTNAVGTVISRWWTSQYKEDGKHKFLELVDNVAPNTEHKRTLNVSDIKNGFVHAKTHLIRDGILGGHVLLPFASVNVPVNENTINDPKIDKMNYFPDTSRWSSYYFDIRDIKRTDPPNIPANEATRRVVSLYLGNPTMRTVSSPLFLQFVNNCNAVPRDILVTFGTEYNVGKSIIIPHRKKVTGILMLAESGEWTSFSPWTCDGRPL